MIYPPFKLPKDYNWVDESPYPHTFIACQECTIWCKAVDLVVNPVHMVWFLRRILPIAYQWDPVTSSRTFRCCIDRKILQTGRFMNGFKRCPQCMGDCNHYIMVHRPFTLAAFAAESIFFNMRNRYGDEAARAIRKLEIPEPCRKDIREIQGIHAFFHLYAQGATRTFLGIADEEAEAQEEVEAHEETDTQEEDETQEEPEAPEISESLETEEHQETKEDEVETYCCIRVNRNTCHIL